jgi:hypothetical protein
MHIDGYDAIILNEGCAVAHASCNGEKSHNSKNVIFVTDKFLSKLAP